jgi:hypothetical protein
MKRVHVLTISGLAAIAVALLLVTSGSAQSTGGRTLTFFESNKGSTFKFIDEPPKSRRGHEISIGDEIAFSQPILDRRGGTAIGRAYGTGTFVKGTKPGNALVLGRGALKLADGEIIVEGLLRSTDSPHTDTLAVVGGTGAYEGARGSFSSEQASSGSQDTIRLLP